MEPKYDPSEDVSDERVERVSMLRLFLYSTHLYILPTVAVEADAIKDAAKHFLHDSLWKNLFVEVDLSGHVALVDSHKKVLKAWHPREGDCQIAAEAEVSKIDVLLTNDSQFIRKVNGKLKVILCKPSEYLASLNIASGSQPRVSPAKSNPLADKNWWRI